MSDWGIVVAAGVTFVLYMAAIFGLSGRRRASRPVHSWGHRRRRQHRESRPMPGGLWVDGEPTMEYMVRLPDDDRMLN